MTLHIIHEGSINLMTQLMPQPLAFSCYAFQLIEDFNGVMSHESIFIPVNYNKEEKKLAVESFIATYCKKHPITYIMRDVDYPIDFQIQKKMEA